MEYKDRLLIEYRDLVEKRAKIINSNHIQGDSLLQKQAEIMMQYEEILFERIARIMHESDAKTACESVIRCN